MSKIPLHINLMNAEGSKTYQNLLFFDTPVPENIEFLHPEWDTPGKIYNLDDVFPMNMKLLFDRHPELVKNADGTNKNWFYRSMQDNTTQKRPSRDELMYLMDDFDNPTKAIMQSSHDNEYIRRISESIVKGKFEEFDITIGEVKLDTTKLYDDGGDELDFDAK